MVVLTRFLFLTRTVVWVGVGAFLVSASVGLAQNLLPNGGFESGTDKPAGWRSSDARTPWVTNAHSGQHALAVTGDGNSSTSWRSEPIRLTPGGLYRFSFFARREQGGGGSVVSGPSRVNRDFNVSEKWSRQSFVFALPADATNDYVRLGQWMAKGRVLFDDAALVPVLANHAPIRAGRELGEAESIHAGVYRFTPHFGWMGANFHRPLYVNRASFNSDRWLFSPGAEVVYRLGVASVSQRSATVKVNVNYHTAGAVAVDASRDGVAWRKLGEFDGTKKNGVLNLPAELFPAEHVFVRLRAEGAKVNLQVNGFDYEAPLAGTAADAEGRTGFMAVMVQNPNLEVLYRGARLTNASAWVMDLTVSNRTGQALDLRGVTTVDQQARGTEFSVKVAAHGTQPVQPMVACPGPGAHSIMIGMRAGNDGRNDFLAETEEQLYFLQDPRPGHFISETPALGVWWCESAWKIGRERGMPERATATPLAISAAIGEYEPAQVVLRSAQGGQLLSAAVAGLRDVSGRASGIEVAIDEVAYVQVTHPTDGTSQRGWHPDPLPPLKGPIELEAGRNQPLWLTVHAPRNTAAGDYTGEVAIETTLGHVRVPLQVHVYGFALPAESHLRSAFGLGGSEINRYHKLKTQADKEAASDKYLGNFAAHRISPYSFFDYAPITVTFPGTGTNKHAQVDFTKFDAAATKWLAAGGFNSFRLPLKGMGGGTFESRSLGKLEGFEEGTPEHARLFRDYVSQVERHLAERGWLDKAYIYWFDEPDRKDYEFVVAGMKRLKAAAPGLKRMLTEQPEKELLGNVDIWCGLTPEWTQEKVRARRAAGEDVWWYICCSPKAPYVTEFIDHPGTELRLWPWQSWQYDVQGILVWASLYWTSGAAFPAPKVQDPWTDPMSYVGGYNFKAGHVGYWGNGDGRFVYPPRRDPNTSTNAVLDGPINSVRWENLRDGMEDYEYFWLLRQEVERLRAKASARALVAEAESLLVVPSDISTDLTHFTTDPRLMMNHRDRVARMIERMRKER